MLLGLMLLAAVVPVHGGYFISANESVACSTPTFNCTHVFDTGVYGDMGRSGDPPNLMVKFGRDRVGPDFLQDTTEGLIHTESVFPFPNRGLSAVAYIPPANLKRRLLKTTKAVGNQENAPYHLTYLHKATCVSSPCDIRDRVFRSAHTGEGVTIYSIGEDINTNHAEFAFNRLSSDKYLGAGSAALRSSICRTWQGTHVAALAAGVTYGVAKDARVVAVAVKPGCRTAGTAIDYMNGLQWVINHHKRNPGPAVAVITTKISSRQVSNDVGTVMSEGLVRKILDRNITVVVASGALTADACLYSPGRMKGVITVAALEILEINGDWVARPWQQSNYGECIDIWAPGAWIESAFAPGPRATQVYSGVPQAAGLVAGVAAIILGENPSSTPAQVADQLFSWSSETLLMYDRPETSKRVLQVRL